MKRFFYINHENARNFAKSVNIFRVLSCCFAVSFFCATAFAQGKIGLIDTEAFHDKQTGIREIVELDEKLEAEFKPQIDELSALAAKILKLQKEIEELNTRLSCKACKFPLEAFEELKRKIEENEKLIREYKLKENVAKELYYKRKAEVFADVCKRIGDALKQFAKEKGYALILDVSKMDDDLILINSDEIESLTKEFIRFYNANFVKAR